MMDTIKIFTSKAPEFRHIYACEPTLYSFYQLIENTKDIDKSYCRKRGERYDNCRRLES